MDTLIRHAVFYAMAAIAAASAPQAYAQTPDFDAMKRSLEAQIELYRQINDHERRITALEDAQKGGDLDLVVTPQEAGAGPADRDAPDAGPASLSHLPSPCVVKIGADWCASCKNENVTEWAEASGWTVVPIDVEDDLAEELGVEKLPTFVVVRNHSEVARYVGNSARAFEPILNGAIAGADAAQAPTEYSKIAEGLDAAGFQPGQSLVDIGCGDGRVLLVASEQFGASRATGIEMDQNMVDLTRRRFANMDVSDTVSVIMGDATKIDLPEADVGYVYLYPETLEVLRDKLTRKYGTVVSYLHQIPGLPMQKRGDFYVWKRGQSRPAEQQRTVTQYQWQQVYVAPWQTGRPCGNRACVMCYGGYQWKQVPVQVSAAVSQAATQQPVRYCRSCGRR